MCQCLGKMGSFDFFGSNLFKNVIRIENLGNECQNKNQHPRDTLIYYILQFSDKKDKFDIFGPNLPKSGLRVGNSEN